MKTIDRVTLSRIATHAVTETCGAGYFDLRWAVTSQVIEHLMYGLTSEAKEEDLRADALRYARALKPAAKIIAEA